jgi:hypothetical protein
MTVVTGIAEVGVIRMTIVIVTGGRIGVNVMQKRKEGGIAVTEEETEIAVIGIVRGVALVKKI